MNFETISPIDRSVCCHREYATEQEIEGIVASAVAAQASWSLQSVAVRAQVCHRAIDILKDSADEIARELTQQMGRPISQTPGELRGVEERAHYLIDIAATELLDISVEPIAGFKRFIRRVPHGVVLTLAPWNYPFLTAINSIIPALMAGNSVVLKHSEQTPLCSERLADAFSTAAKELSVTSDLLQFIHLTYPQVAALIADSRIDYVSFTGSVEGGRAVQRAASARSIPVALELGGKDAAYVRADADVGFCAENLVDGSFFNSGQSCCGIERIYVHKSVYESFIEKFVECTNCYVLGDPNDKTTTLGPVVSIKAATAIREQISEAIAAGARALIDTSRFPADTGNTEYLAPQVLVDVTHDMRIMKEETFGPVVGILPVDSDEQAIAYMSDTEFGLTASIWTADDAVAEELGDKLDVGTVFMNRCDYLDPALAWVGVRSSGRGCSLSKLAYSQYQT